MNPVQQICCRAFQAALRLAIPLLPYRRPETVERVEDLPAIIRARGCTRVLLVTDPGVMALGLTRRLEESLSLAGMFCAVYDRTVANPTTVQVEEARELYLERGCQAIIGFGGGSSMDCAKAAAIRAARPRKPLSKCRGILKVRARLPLLIAVPTTAGTGSETTLAAVITDADTRHKYAINDFPLIPRYAVLDPAITVSLPPALTASTGMDALTHAVEAYIGRSTTRDTREASLTAVRLIFENLDAAYADGNNLTARRNMLHASYLAGCAFTKSYVGYVHAVAHSLGGVYNVPHGRANAVILPMVLEAYGPAAHRRLAELARAAGIAGADVPAPEAAGRFIQAVKDMKRRFGIGDTIPELKRADIPRLARYAAREGNPLYPVPVLMDAGELARLYEGLLEESV